MPTNWFLKNYRKINVFSDIMNIVTKLTFWEEILIVNPSVRRNQGKQVNFGPDTQNALVVMNETRLKIIYYQ